MSKASVFDHKAKQPLLTWYANPNALGFKSENGEYEIRVDEFYGYYTLHASDNLEYSLMEHFSELVLMHEADRLDGLSGIEQMYGYHVSNPVNRASILTNGLQARAGWSYKYNHGPCVKPAIFLSLELHHKFHSTYDDDVFKVNLSGVTLLPDVKNKNHFITYDALIHPHSIALIYCGSGK